DSSLLQPPLLFSDRALHAVHGPTNERVQGSKTPAKNLNWFCSQATLKQYFVAGKTRLAACAAQLACEGLRRAVSYWQIGPWRRWMIQPWRMRSLWRGS